MSTTKHTPGPWVVKPTIKNNYDIIQNIDWIDYGFSWVASTVSVNKDSETILSNAKLIALAPEMLQIIEDVLKEYNRGEADIPVALLEDCEYIINSIK